VLKCILNRLQLVLAKSGQANQAKLRQTQPGQDEENDNKYFVAFAARLQCSMGVFRGVAKGGDLKSRLCQRLNAPKCQLFLDPKRGEGGKVGSAGSAARKI